MRSKSKIFHLLLVLSLAFVMIVSACSSANNTTSGTQEPAGGSEPAKTEQPSEPAKTEPAAEPAPTGPVTLTYMIDNEPGRPIDGSKPIPALLASKVNAEFEMISHSSDNYLTKLTTVLIGGNLPDLITFTPQAKFIYDEYSDELLVPLDEYINAGKMPSIKKLMDQFPDFAKIMTNPDGHIYGLPNLKGGETIQFTVHIRDDLLKKKGIDINNIKTVDDWYAAFRAMKGAVSSEPPFINRGGYNRIGAAFLPNFGAAQTMYYDEEAQTYTVSALSENFKIAIKFLSDMYKEGILDPDFLNEGESRWEAQQKKNEAAIMADNIGHSFEAWKNGTDPSIVEGHLMPPEINGKRAKLRVAPQIDLIRITSIAKTSPNIETAVAMLDYAYSDEGVDLLFYGREGIEWVPDNTQPIGKYFYNGVGQFGRLADGSDDPNIPNNPGYDVTGMLTDGIFYVWPAAAVQGYYYLTKEQTTLAQRVPNLVKFFRDNNALGGPLPSIVFNEEELEVIKNVGTPLWTLIDEHAVQFILGQLDVEKDWASFQDKIKAAGYEQIEKVYNDALTRYNQF